MAEKEIMTPDKIQLPYRDRDAHKGNFGRVCILGGSVGYSGAPVLAARAAVRTGSGLVTVLVPQPLWPIAAVKLNSAMPYPLPATEKGAFAYAGCGEALERLNRADTALIGPGMGCTDGTAEMVRFLCRELTVPLVLDADGINALEGHIDCLDDRKGRITVLTPHEGEFARLGGKLTGNNRETAALDFARAHGCILVLKGHRTLTAFPNGQLVENRTGNPGMAKGGSGDVLAGMILSRRGQGLPLEQAVPWAVCLHGQAGDMAAEELGEYGMTPTDLVKRIPLTMKRF